MYFKCDLRKSLLIKDLQKLSEVLLVKLEKLDTNALRGLVDSVPDDWMTPSARKFAIAVLCCNFERLGELIL